MRARGKKDALFIKSLSYSFVLAYKDFILANASWVHKQLYVLP